jgi:hypothetical protein
MEMSLSKSPHFTTVQQCGLDNDFIQNRLQALFDEIVILDMQLLQSLKSMNSI